MVLVHTDASTLLSVRETCKALKEAAEICLERRVLHATYMNEWPCSPVNGGSDKRWQHDTQAWFRGAVVVRHTDDVVGAAAVFVNARKVEPVEDSSCDEVSECIACGVTDDTRTLLFCLRCRNDVCVFCNSSVTCCAYT